LSVPCHIEIDGFELKMPKATVFAELPRIGETVVLDWEGDRYSKFLVYEVRHVAEGVKDMPAFTVLLVRRALD
jgi:hypothetical protein